MIIKAERVGGTYYLHMMDERGVVAVMQVHYTSNRPITELSQDELYTAFRVADLLNY